VGREISEIVKSSEKKRADAVGDCVPVTETLEENAQPLSLVWRVIWFVSPRLTPSMISLQVRSQ
jgi:hypothetical protein